MKETLQSWKYTFQLVPAAGLVGATIGFFVGSHNEDQVGWALLRMVCFAVFFAYAARYILKTLMRAWVESKIHELEAQVKAKQAAIAAAAKGKT
jgi:hypothetical protein